jgi:hypothetical protein
MATLGHPYEPDSPSMKQTLHALMMTDFMGKYRVCGWSMLAALVSDALKPSHDLAS